MKSCGPDVAVLASSRRERKSFAGDGGKRAVLRGEHEASRKAIAQGRPGCSTCTCMLVCKSLPLRKRHMGPRVQQAPGLPCALKLEGQDVSMQGSGEVTREIAKLHPRHCERSDLSAEALAKAEAIHPSAYAVALDCFAALAMTGIGRR